MSAFASGWAGIGLLLMRVACGGVLITEAVRQFIAGSAPQAFAYIALLTLAGLAILAGFCSKMAGAGAAALEVCALAFGDGSALIHSLLATLGAALSMLGPGAWSIDARLSGWRRIYIPGREE